MRWLSPEYRRERLWIFVILATLFWGIPLLLFLYVLFEMPSFERLENPSQDLASVAYSADGQVLGTFYHSSDRVRVGMSQIPDVVKKALIAIEDKRFYEHAGIDPNGVAAAILSIFTGKPRGGSTITQQLARNLYDEVGVERSLWRKLKEMVVAIYLEYRYSKEEILAMYLNTVPFGGVVYGIQAASRYYFDKDAQELTLSEAALLIGLLKGPSYYSPYKYPERALARRNLVIDKMREESFISAAEAAEAKKAPLGVGKAPYTASQSQGLAPYFREYLRQWLLQWARQRGYDLYRDGLQIYTTIDSRLQQYAESAVVKHLREFQPLFDKELAVVGYPWKRDSSILWRALRRSERYNAMKSAGASEAEIRQEFQKPVPMRLFSWRPPGYIDTVLSPMDSLAYYLRFLEAGVVTIDPHTGEIKAWVGGINHTYFKYDHVAQAKRQVGSTFKPFVYTAAMDNGYSPCYEELNIPVEITVDAEKSGAQWTPRNADRSFGGKVSLRRALALSLNLVTARLMKALGPEVVISYARRMGIQSEMEAVPSLALGVCDLTLLELTSAYGTFPTLGIWREPIFIREIRDRRGNIIEQFNGISRRALSEQTAYLMVEMLRWVAIGGTASSLRWRYDLADLDIGGKTGTTQNHADAWFVGFTPDYVTGVWVGTADRNVHFYSAYGQGATMAMPIWGLYMKAVYSDTTLGIDKKKRIMPPQNFVLPDCNQAPQEEAPDAPSLQDFLR